VLITELWFAASRSSRARRVPILRAGNTNTRQQQERYQRDLPGDPDHHDEGEQQSHDVPHDTRESVTERALRADNIIVQTAHQSAGSSAGEEGDRHALYVIEHRGPQIENQRLADGGRKPARNESNPGLGDGDQRDQQGERDDDILFGLLNDLVHHSAGQNRSRDGKNRRDHAQEKKCGEFPAVRAREGSDAPKCRLRERPFVLLRVHRVVHRHPRGDLHVHRFSSCFQDFNGTPASLTHNQRSRISSSGTSLRDLDYVPSAADVRLISGPSLQVQRLESVD